MLNHISMQLRLTADPVVRYTQEGNPVTSFRGACDRDFSKETDFVDVVCFKKTAEFVSKYFAKGSLLVVDGRLQMNEWTDRDGNRRTTHQIIAERVYFCERKQGGDEPNPAPISGKFVDAGDFDPDGDLPF